MYRPTFSLGLLFCLVNQSAFADDRAPVVVELFTSEGCSSCPPADRALEKLERNQPVPGARIIPLGFHVDYWNRLGWADPFSSRVFSSRQEKYSEAFGGNRVYTPQMVVGGVKEFVGEEAQTIQFITEVSRQTKAAIQMTLAARCGSSTEVKISADTLPDPVKGDAVELLFAVTESGLVSQVTRGENAGRTLRHTAVVRLLRSLGETKGERGKVYVATTNITPDKAWKASALHMVAFLQEKKSRRILGATTEPFCPQRTASFRSDSKHSTGDSRGSPLTPTPTARAGRR